MANSKGRFEY